MFDNQLKWMLQRTPKLQHTSEKVVMTFPDAADLTTRTGTLAFHFVWYHFHHSPTLEDCPAKSCVTKALPKYDHASLPDLRM